MWRWMNSRIRADTMMGRFPSIKDSSEQKPEHMAVVVGYGPVGRTLTRLLRENGVEPTVVELNLDSVRRIQAEGTRAVYGDAMHRETLLAAGIERAVAVILTSAGMRGSEEVIRLAREVNSKVRVFARTAYLREIEVLRQAGADVVFSS
jgi:CPA2 family monovalent cation:H+ antiporter-2